ncbi:MULTISPECIES: serine hydrolase [Virgibacillus]|uniref:Beta-lactamase class A catalytic domain-containing protein n=2 Tax=Virgibacillus TaxID=84406 RepID=A0A024Q8C3_9BACI|nr:MULTISPECIES: serine hydrolase [Virgibacillus]EQB38302.1 hypothetical protein M948_06900 [Virgibacillus sp. CM-4]MYL41007.1 serine hydrolase [Virgibacillus massiliensis]GGJ53527.1 serine hydrolase [Virgibacillus kapii]CDQ38191.1 hypothetical protein BN990_00458 [Virgibacillus massiliensis]
MDFNELEWNIKQKLKPSMKYFSIYIETPDGIIAINEDKQMTAASLVKLPILLEGFRQLENNHLLEDKLVYIDKDEMVGGAGVINYVSKSHIYSYKNLMELMIIVSDNTAANLLLKLFGMAAINQFIKSIDCEQTLISRKFMDVEASENGKENYTSAKDMIKLFKLVSKTNHHLTDSSRRMILKILENQQFTHKLPSYLDKDKSIRFFHKTGEMPGVSHDAGIIKYETKTIHVAILSEGVAHNTVSERIIADIGHLLSKYIKEIE